MRSKADSNEAAPIYTHKIKGPYEAFFKRALDIILSGLAIMCLSWLMFIVSVIVRINLGSPVIFTQDRLGRNGKVFKLYKFRSMSNATDANGNLLPAEQRLNRLGKIFRSTSLDELPELINIFKGDMSIVGPRPLLVAYLPHYNKHDARRHEVRPGLTGLSQVSGRNTLTWKDKFQKDVEYVDNITFIGDMSIIMLTVKKIFTREGIEFVEGHQSVMDYFKENVDS